jgi:Tfp pilus assembly protein PilW
MPMVSSVSGPDRQRAPWTGRLFLDQRGFSLADLLVSIVVLGLVMGAIVTAQMAGGTIFAASENKAAAQQAARAAMLMDEDLRLVGYGVPPTVAAVTAATATSFTFLADLQGASTTLSAAANAGDTTLNVGSTAGIAAGNTIYLINGNQSETKTVGSTTATTITVGVALANAYAQGAQVGRPLTVVYSFAGGNLTKDPGDGTAVQTLASGLSSVAFTYYDSTNTVTTTVSAIRAIQVTTTATSTTASSTNSGAFTVTSKVRPRNL